MKSFNYSPEIINKYRDSEINLKAIISFPMTRNLLIILISLTPILSTAQAKPDSSVTVKEVWKNGLHLQVNYRKTAVAKPWLYYWYAPKGQTLPKTKIDSVAAGQDGYFLLKTAFLDTTLYFTTDKPFRRYATLWKPDQYKIKSLAAYINPVFTTSDCSLSAGLFCSGHIMLNKWTSPGGLYIINPRGSVEWKMEFEKYGVKVAKFTQDSTLLLILGDESDPTSYGRRILEMTPAGDTLADLSLERGHLPGKAHHEILKTPKGQYLMLVELKQLFDLSKAGGSRADTVSGDGILMIDKKGKKIWSWNLFDHLNPAAQENIVRKRRDWSHANSLTYDSDGNYLLSLFNLSQVWKIDSKTGVVIWKLARKGNIVPDSTCGFAEVHTFQHLKEGYFLYFDNGLKNARSSIKAINIDTRVSAAALLYKIPLPKNAFSPRMGSVRLLQDSLFLTCASKANQTILLNRSGDVLWKLKSNFNPYRADFISAEAMKLFIKTDY